MTTRDDPFSQTSDEELLLSIVMAHFNDSPSRTLSEILATDEKHRQAGHLDPSDPAARETAARLGITPEKYEVLQQEMDAEERERRAVEIPAALDELVRRRVLTHVGDTYTVTSEGRAYLEHKQAQGIAARAAHGSTPEARSYVLSLLGPEGGSLYDVIGRSKEHDGFGLEKDWAQLNLDELLARGEVTQVADKYIPTRP